MPPAPSARSNRDGLRGSAILVVAATVLFVDYFVGSATWAGRDRAVLVACLVRIALLFVVPAAFARLALGISPRDLGLGFGNARDGWRWFVPLWILFVGAGVVLSRVPSVHAHYPEYRPMLVHPALWIPVTLLFGAASFASEFCFRGFLMFGTGRSTGRAAIALQLVPFVLTHYVKGPIELIGAAGAGAIFGALAWRSRSILPSWLIHWSLSTTVNVLSAYWSLSN